MEKLTKHQENALKVIQRSIQQRGYPPSVRELCDLLGLKSTATVHTYLRTLERKGYIKRTPFRSRALEVVENSDAGSDAVMVPIVGRVRAGVPILAIENVEDIVPLPRSFVRSERAFLLKVEGDSMVEAGIQDGDYVLVRQQDTADDGDIVVALLEDEATVKVFYRDRDAVRLEPRNPDFEPIVAKDVKILGKVIGLYRSIAS
ncbi:MAG TPA: transcriptional repressor LexA [Firmicutes bacterium]|nr:transcriptional repressor LexA [Candidatus Fermentithermobacillaceae bacterium]